MLPPLPYFAVFGIRTLIRVTCSSLHGRGPYIPYVILSSLSYRVSVYATISAFSNAAHHLLCFIRGNSFICLYCPSDVPGTLLCPVVPGERTSASLTYLHAVFGLFQNALCKMVDTSPLAHARETAPLDGNELMERSWFSLATTDCCLSKRVTCGAVRNNDPLTGTLSAPTGMCANKYPLVMSHPASVPTAIQCSTAFDGHVAKLTSWYGVVIKCSADMFFPLWTLNMDALRCVSTRLLASSY